MNDSEKGSAQPSSAQVVDARTREQIETLMLDYVHALDDAQWDRWPEFFEPDGLYRIATRENHEAGLPLGIMYCDGQGMMRDRMLALQTANVFEPHTHCHHISRSEIRLDGDVFRVRTNFQVVRTMQSGSMEIFAVGKYLDAVSHSPSGVALRERIVVIDSRRIDILLVAPL